jgi:hypothetical protein
MDTGGTDTSLLRVPKRLHAKSDFLKLEIKNHNPQASVIHHLADWSIDPPPSDLVPEKSTQDSCGCGTTSPAGVDWDALAE